MTRAAGLRPKSAMTLAVLLVAGLLFGGFVGPAKATSTLWSAPAAVSNTASAAENSYEAPKLVASANASIVTAVWQQNTETTREIWANRSTDSGRTWSSAARVSAAAANTMNPSQLAVVASTDGLVVTAVWKSNDNNLLASRSVSGTWDASPTTIYSGGDAGVPVAVSSDDGNTVTVAWAGGSIMYANRYASSSWGASTQISATQVSGYPYVFSAPSLVSNPAGTVVTAAWQSRVRYQASPQRFSLEIRANQFSGGSWASGTNPVLVSAAASANFNSLASAYEVKAARQSDGTVTIAWHAIVNGSTYPIQANSFAEGGWPTIGSVSTISSTAATLPNLAADSSGVTATWYDSGAIWANRYSGTWGTAAAISDGSSTPSNASASPPIVATTGGPGATVAWRVNNAGNTEIWANRYLGSWSGPTKISGTDSNTANQDPSLTVSADGATVTAGWPVKTASTFDEVQTNRLTSEAWAADPSLVSAPASASTNALNNAPGFASSSDGSTVVTGWVSNDASNYGQVMSATFPAAAPTVISIDPTEGTTAGGTSVTITGTGFQSGATASIGAVTCASVSVTSTTTLTCTTGAHGAGTADVVVTNTDDQFGTLTSGYTFVAPTEPPVNDVAPAVSGTATSGSELSTTDGSWSGTPTITFTYQWQTCTTANCVGGVVADISGATASTFTLTPAQGGKYVRSVVSASNDGGGPITASSNITALIPPVAPTNYTAPAVSGTATSGSELDTTDGSWSGTPTITFTYQWQTCTTNNCVGGTVANISGATASTFVLTPAQSGKYLRSVVSATNSGGGPIAATSNVVGPVPSTVVAPTNVTAPAVTGTPTSGQSLSVSNGTWTGAPTSYAYAWQTCTTANCAAGATTIAGQTAATLTLTSAQVGKFVRATVTASNTAGPSTPKPSAPAVKVTGPALTPALSAATSTANGFRFTITNYNPAFTWVGSSTNGGTVGIVNNGNGTASATVTGLFASQSATATITTTRTDYAPGSAQRSATASPPAKQVVVAATPAASQFVIGQYIPVNVTISQQRLTRSSRAGVYGQAVVSINGARACTATITNGRGTCIARIRTMGNQNFSVVFTGTVNGQKVKAKEAPTKEGTSATVSITRASARINVCTMATTLAGRALTPNRTVVIQRFINGKWRNVTATRTNTNKNWATRIQTPTRVLYLRATDGKSLTAVVAVRASRSTRGC